MNGRNFYAGLMLLLAFAVVNGQDEGSRESDEDLVPLSPVADLTPHIPTPIQPPSRDITELLFMYRLLMWYMAGFTIEVITTTTTVEESETTEPTTLPVITTATTLPAENPCTKWTKVGTCQYYLFADRLSWNDANAKCQMSCDSKLAFRQIQDSVGRAAVVNALGSTPATFWVGLTDSDGSAIGALAKWNGATTAAVDAADYLTVDGVPSCGYYEPTSTNGINLRDCYQIPTDKPAGFLCEFCL